MKNIFFILITLTFLFLSSNSKSQYKGGSYDGYSSKLDTNIPYPVGIKKIEGTAENYILYQNYPNPFNPSTVISYQLSVSNFVELKVYDAQGKEVATLVNQKQNAGSYSIDFGGSNLPSGIYFYHIVIHSDKIQDENSFTDTKKMILIK